MSRVTIRDVAREAGVSASAVSRVFGDGNGVAEATRAKVLAAADTLGYRPNALARGLIHASIDLVAVVIGRIRSPFDTRFLELLSHRLAAHDLRTLLIPADPDDGEGPLLTALDWQVTATVVSAGTLPKTTVERYGRVGIPLIVAGSTLTAPETDCVMSVNRESTRAATDLLLRSGCRRVAYFGLTHRPQSDLEREQGVRDALDAAGLPLHAHALAHSRPDQSQEPEEAVALLSREDTPDAVVCATDSLALVMLEAARRLCLRVPDQVSVVGFDNVPQAGWSMFDLTTIHYPVEDLVDWIVARILLRRDHKDLAPLTHRIPTVLVPRGTTRSGVQPDAPES